MYVRNRKLKEERMKCVGLSGNGMDPSSYRRRKNILAFGAKMLYNHNMEVRLMIEQEINAITQRFVEQLHPQKVYLFGSHAKGTGKDDSDIDFYIIVDDSDTDWHEISTKAYRSIRHVRIHPVDILIGTVREFEERKNRATIENEVFKTGVLLYAA